MGCSEKMPATDSDESSQPPLPEGVLPLRKYHDRDGYYLSLTEEIRDQTALSAGDFVHLEYDDDLGLLSASEVEPPEDYDPRTSTAKKLMDNRSAIRLTVPRRTLYDLDVPIDDYPEEDPFLFRFEVDQELALEERTFFALTPLGHASDVFRTPTDLPDGAAASPISHDLVRDYAAEFDLDAEALTDALTALGQLVDDRTFEALGVESRAPPTLLKLGRHQVEIHYLPEGGFGEVGRLFAFEPEIVTGAYRLHYEVAAEAIENLYEAEDEPVPDDHPLRAMDTEPIVVPDGEASDEAEPEAAHDERREVERLRVPPVTPAVIQQTTGTTTVNRETLHDALVEMTRTLSGSGSSLDDATDTGVVKRVTDAVTLPFDPGHDQTADYEQVRIEFVASSNVEHFATDIVGLDDEEAMAVKIAYNRQAERLLREADVDPSLRRFRREADAILIPAVVAPDGGVATA